jgi:hypothetical protein
VSQRNQRLRLVARLRPEYRSESDLVRLGQDVVRANLAQCVPQPLKDRRGVRRVCLLKTDRASPREDALMHSRTGNAFDPIRTAEPGAGAVGGKQFTAAQNSYET